MNEAGDRGWWAEAVCRACDSLRQDRTDRRRGNRLQHRARRLAECRCCHIGQEDGQAPQTATMEAWALQGTLGQDWRRNSYPLEHSSSAQGHREDGRDSARCRSETQGRRAGPMRRAARPARHAYGSQHRTSVCLALRSSGPRMGVIAEVVACYVRRWRVMGRPGPRPLDCGDSKLAAQAVSPYQPLGWATVGVRSSCCWRASWGCARCAAHRLARQPESVCGNAES